MPNRKRRSTVDGEPAQNEGTPLAPPDAYQAESSLAPRIVPQPVSLSKEIAARHEAEEKLRLSEERLRLALDGAHMGTWHWDLNSGELLWSPHCLALFGFPPGTRMTYRRFLDTLRPEDKPRVDEGVSRALAEHSDYEAEFHIQWPDGSWHWIASRGRGYYDSRGTPVRMEGVAFDISSRKMAERAAAEREADLQRAQAMAKVGSWTLELETGKHVASPQMYRILGLPEGSLPQLSLDMFLEFVAPEDREHVGQTWREALQGRPYDMQCRIRTNQGTRWVVSHAEVQFEAGRPWRVFGTTQDITELKLAEQKLATEKLFTDAVLHSVPGLLYLYDSKGRLVRWNKQHEDLTGYSAEQLRGRHILEWFQGDDAARIRDAVQQAFNTGQAQAEAELVTRWGTRIPFYFTAHRLEIEGNAYFTGIGLDISALKNTQRELAARTEELDRFFYIIPELLCIIDLDGCFRRVNLMWEKLLGYKQEELLNKRFFEFVHPDEVESARAALRDFVRARIVQGYVNRYRHKDGSYRWLEWHSVISGDFAYAGARDITERRQAEQALLQSEEQLRAFVQNAPYGVTRASIAEDRFLSVNPALVRMLGYDSEEEVLRLKLSRDIYPNPEDRAHFLAQLPPNGRFRGIEVTWKRKDGSLITARTSGRRTSIEGSNYDIIEAIDEDITEHRVLQEQFRQAQKLEAVGRLAGGVAHDFNNMLGVILGYCEIIAMEVGQGNPVHSRLDVIRKTCERAASLTSQLLAFSRRQVLQPKVVDVNDVVSETEKMLRRVIGEDITLRRELSDDLAHVKADPAQLVQIVMNLAINARDAMPSGGTLTISTRNVSEGERLPGCKAPSGDCVAMSVSDTGVGMDSETQSHIFEPFFTTKPSGKGTGLGLSTVYGIVQQSGGCICVHSQPGAGTTVTICLPRYDAPLMPATQEAAQAPRKTTPGTVLLVEDELSLRDALATQLETAGYTVLRAVEGSEAIAIARNRTTQIDLLITDIVMPRMRGQELAEQLRTVHPETKVLYMSGYADDLGADTVDEQHFIQKPFRFSDVVERAQKLLET